MSTPADLILHNGRIATQVDRRSMAQAAAIQDGKFVAVGSDRDIMPLRGDGTKNHRPQQAHRHPRPQ